MMMMMMFYRRRASPKHFYDMIEVDDTVVGVAPARWTTAGMKREAGMQGSRSEGVDERGRSLVMDGALGYQLQHGGEGRRWMGWRTTADRGGWGFSAGAERLWQAGISNGEKEAMGGGTMT